MPILLTVIFVITTIAARLVAQKSIPEDDIQFKGTFEQELKNAIKFWEEENIKLTSCKYCKTPLIDNKFCKLCGTTQ